MKFNSIDDMLAKLQDAIDDSLINEVAKEVRETEKRAIDDVVYGSYSPVLYKRRRSSGGLGADESIVATPMGRGMIAVDNIAPLNDDYPEGWGTPHPAATRAGFSTAAEAVISGRGYDFPSDPYASPRDFIQRTKDELNSSSKVSDALKKGLKRNGFL